MYYFLGFVIVGLIIYLIVSKNSHAKSLKTLKLEVAQLPKYKENLRQEYELKTDEMRGHYVNKSLFGSIYKTLSAMDATYNVYQTEDEANRELTTGLKLLGHTATYHQELSNGRLMDIFADGQGIIEGKLEPTQAEIDRLIGQVIDYLEYDYHVYIVLYGAVSDTILKRIKTQITDKHSKNVTLIYLSEANRVRKLKETTNINSMYNDEG